MANAIRKGHEIIIGAKYGLWTVLKRVENPMRTKFLCRCECGLEKELPYMMGRIKSNSCRSCSSKQKKSGLVESKNNEVLGKKFGKLTALRVTDRPDGKRNWIDCQCECGTIYSVRRPAITPGKGRKRKGCKPCAIKSNSAKCEECGCDFKHIYIDIEESNCDMLGFCYKCDGFIITEYLGNSWHAARRYRNYKKYKS